MTILPELRDALVATRAHQPVLPQLRDGLVRTPSRRQRRRRPLLIGLLAASGLAATGGALAATGALPLPPTGDPVTPTHVQRDPERGSGVPTGPDGRLLGLRVADPAGGPPWGLRLVATTRGMLCLQPGRVVGDRLGVLGQDGIEGDDGRFHPLPTAGAGSWPAPCVPPDGAGHFFTAMDRPSYAGGDAPKRTCREPGERDAKDEPPCPAADERRIAYGVLGPEAIKVTFADGSTQVPEQPEGGYLHVVRRAVGDDATVVGGLVAGFPNGTVARIDYRDGTSCPAPEQKGVGCEPKGYVEPAPSTKDIRAKLTVRYQPRTKLTRVTVRFRAPQAVTDAQHRFAVEGRFPDSPLSYCRHAALYAATDRNLDRGDSITLSGTFSHRCRGRLEARVELQANDTPLGVVGRFSETLPLAAGRSGPP